MAGYGRKNRYGKPVRTSSASSGRFSRAKAYSKKKRSTKYSRARTGVPTKRKNATLARGNARKIARLKSDLYGPRQTMTSTMLQPGGNGFIVVRDHPLLFQADDPMNGTHGPDLYTTQHLGNGDTVRLSQHFATYIGEGNQQGDYHEKDRHIPNGPKLKLNTMHYKFKFTGVLPDTRIRVDFIRQKKIVHDFWNQGGIGTKNFLLPATLQSLRNLAGFTPNHIDKTTFQVLATRHVYLNSEASQTSLDGGISYTMEQSTTPDSKICSVYMKLNKVYNQLHVSQDEPDGDEDLNVAEAPMPFAGIKGPYKYTNLHPCVPIWCLISCDDTTSVSDLIPDADGVDRGNLRVEIVRTMTWQDARE